MGAFPSTIPTSGGGSGSPQSDSGDPSSYLGGQPQSGGQPGGSPASGATPDFVRSVGQMGMQLKQTLTDLSGQYPAAAEAFRVAIKSIDAGIAKILTASPQAANGPETPRSV